MTREEKIFAYLPYEPRCLINGDQRTMAISSLHYHGTELKLILIPMSEVAKPFTYRGETFIPLDRLSLYYRENFKEFLKKLHSRHLTYRMTTQLIAWGFDVFNMIPAGEAVAISTIK